MSGTAIPTLVIVDDHALFRSGVRMELAQGVRVVGEAGSVEAAVTTIRATEPDVVLLDVHMPDGGGLAVIRTIAAEMPEVNFLALSTSWRCPYQTLPKM